jgi:signal transduction histidine kinase
VTLGSEPSAGQHGPRRITLAIVDDGVGAPQGGARDTAAGGVGLLGMRERVQALNGEMSVGRGREGGFDVRISFPERDGTEAAA